MKKGLLPKTIILFVFTCIQNFSLQAQLSVFSGNAVTITGSSCTISTLTAGPRTIYIDTVKWYKDSVLQQVKISYRRWGICKA